MSPKLLSYRRWAIRLPDGRWWRRGHGRPSVPVHRMSIATLYATRQGAQHAATVGELLDRFGGYTLREVIVGETGTEVEVSD